MSTLTQEEQNKLSQFLSTRNLCSGLGDTEISCSVGTINLCLSNTLTACVPSCMSSVIGRWIIFTQDLMPDELRNSPKWKQLLVLAAGTGKEKEEERFAIIAEWFWTIVLPCFQSSMNEIGVGDKWQEAITNRDEQAFTAIYKANIVFKSIIHDSNHLSVLMHGMLCSLMYFINYYKWDVEYKIECVTHICSVLKFAVKHQDKNVDDIWKIFTPCELLEKLVNV